MKRATREQRQRHEEAADWLFRQGDSALTTAEQNAFEDWLDQTPENRQAYDAAARLMGDAGAAIRSDPALSSWKDTSRSPTKAVVGCVLAMAIAGALFYVLDGPMRLRADMISNASEMPTIRLADGSYVRLNASSAIAYDETAGRRVVRLLRGQALFEVATDARRPFVVEAGEIRITALGTAFDVRLGETNTDVTVTQHAVRIDFVEGDHSSLEVSQGERAIIDERTGASVVEPSDPDLALAWMRGQLILDNAPLSYVVSEMNRHFAGKIMIMGEKLAHRRVSGTMTISNTTAALAYVEHALGISAHRIGPLIVLRD